MTLNSYSYLLCFAALLTTGCVSTQRLGDPQATDGEPGDADTSGETSHGERTSTASGTSVGDTDIGTGDPTAPTSSTTTPDLETGSSTEGETDGSEEQCSDWQPPPFDCPEQGDARAGLEVAPEEFPNFDFGGVFTDGIPCEVIALSSDDIDRWTVGLQCDELQTEFTYVSAAPYVSPPLEIGTQVIYTGVDSLDRPNFEPSVSLHSPRGDLLMAFVDHDDLRDSIAVELAPLQVAFDGTGCSGVPDQKNAECNPGESVLRARSTVSINGEQALELADGASGTVTVEGTTYRVTVDEAARIVCWDEGCFGDESGPYDRLRMLVVAEP